VPDEPPLEDESSPPQPTIHVVRGAMDNAMTASERKFLMVGDQSGGRSTSQIVS
jgi:hypothetical protein